MKPLKAKREVRRDDSIMGVGNFLRFNIVLYSGMPNCSRISATLEVADRDRKGLLQATVLS